MSEVDPRTQAAAEAVILAGHDEKSTMRVGPRRAVAALAAADAWDAANGYVRVKVDEPELRRRIALVLSHHGVTYYDVAAVHALAALSGVPAHPKENDG